MDSRVEGIGAAVAGGRVWVVVNKVKEETAGEEEVEEDDVDAGVVEVVVEGRVVKDKSKSGDK
ncbi:hypothetical protein HMI54_005057 [Coelomomyces lativittatus]|nr:hypothetical protein HMI54_005057 [Coelomomyces lativittatus]